MKKKTKIKNTPKYPALTAEEVQALIIQDKEFIDAWGLYGIKLHEVIYYGLSHLATGKLLGEYGYKKNKREAKKHFLKSLVFSPNRDYGEATQKAFDLPPPPKRPKGYKEPKLSWEGSLRLRKIARKNNPKLSFRGNGK